MYKTFTDKHLLLIGNIDDVHKKLKYYSFKFQTLGELISYLNNS
ncbi:hypothetical protein [Senegalia massiliensis]|nr:hypothetical protein [Senegalia massiliensis]